ncbi:hypothetical protein FVE85_2933 [Porphyridium purpureum]|uniref:Uncharacterized protein n=1 Tax=Porphyridium purpureum TaxID=35688 RepID=A0A5J4YV22_PORPP|nr:hypothetical protein FVE85_2933 [Porphyridium purpureum]|eukprot:POR9292..scf227_4
MMSEHVFGKNQHMLVSQLSDRLSAKKQHVALTWREKRDWLAVSDTGMVISRNALMQLPPSLSSTEIPRLTARFATCVHRTREYFAVHKPLGIIHEEPETEQR